jgi:hypothetical protein
MLSISVSCHHKIFQKNASCLSWEITLLNLGKFRTPKIFNSVNFQTSNDAGWTLMLWPLKQATIRKNPLSLSKVMNNLVEPCIAGNAKNKRNWPTLLRNFSATAGTKNLEVVPKLVLGYVLYVDILLVEVWEGARRTMLKFFVSSLR